MRNNTLFTPWHRLNKNKDINLLISGVWTRLFFAFFSPPLQQSKANSKGKQNDSEWISMFAMIKQVISAVEVEEES
jgi:hypothetical protein